MANAKQKITLNASRDIPFNKLILSQANVRRIKRGQTIEELAASIGRRGILQSLNVRPVLDGEGNETGMFEVPAGGRRYRALELLVKQKRMGKADLVPCVVTDANSPVPIEEDSLAENFQREDLHPLDMFRAFKTLYDQGAGHEEIAARFFVTPTFVKQRLRLAKVSPSLLDIYEQDGMKLEELMAFTVSDDHARQEQVWEDSQHSWQREPAEIRRKLTELSIRADSKRAVFVGIDAYEAAGGTVSRDLFEADNGGWLDDPALLDRLVTEKLTALAEEISEEGWKWVAIAVDLPYGHAHGMRALNGVFVELTEEERATREALRDEYDGIEAEYDGADEYPPEVDRRLAEIETALDALENRPRVYDTAEISRAGVFVSISREGVAVIDRGYVRPEDEAPESAEDDQAEPDGKGNVDDAGDAEAFRTTITIGGQPVAPDEEDKGDAVKPLPERLVIELTAHRTLALRNAVAENPHVAFTALLHKLVCDRFLPTLSGGACVRASVAEVYFSTQGTDLAETPYALVAAERHAAWKADLPTDADALWDWLAALDDASRMALLAHCVSFGVTALYERPNPQGTGISQSTIDQRMAEADRLARLTGLDMVEAGFRPTAANYFGKVTKAHIVEAVREGSSDLNAQLIASKLKPEMITEAERLLANSGWLPEPLRLYVEEQPQPQPDEAEAVAALPDFLADDDEGDPATDDEASAVAAE